MTPDPRIPRPGARSRALPIEQWHAYIDEPTLADAILDRLVYNSYRVNLKGGSMRKRKSATASQTASSVTAN